MKTIVRTLSPALVTALLALPLLAGAEKSDPSTGVHANIPSHVLNGDTTSSQQLGQVVRVSDVMGLEVKNLQDEKLGKVNDLAIDVASGRIVEVIVSTGGLLGVGSTLLAVPPAAFHYDHQAKVLHLDRSKESLKGLQPFDVSQWDTHFQSSNVVEVYRAYGVTPYFVHGSGNGIDQQAQVYRRGNTDGTTGNRLSSGEANRSASANDADNTARNRRDKDGNTLTAGDQGNSAGDIAITADIRKAVLARDGLSVNAQNVKIITLNGRVTLRGPVNSEEEKTIIAAIAGGVVEASAVDNQLEVKRQRASK
ncbi:MAG: hypothetical protein RIS76_1099 [Verrucomicrobiota bacterium]|jgi:osmotically-inducible protein OsmY